MHLLLMLIPFTALASSKAESLSVGEISKSAKLVLDRQFSKVWQGEPSVNGELQCDRVPAQCPDAGDVISAVRVTDLQFLDSGYGLLRGRLRTRSMEIKLCMISFMYFFDVKVYCEKAP